MNKFNQFLLSLLLIVIILFGISLLIPKVKYEVCRKKNVGMESAEKCNYFIYGQRNAIDKKGRLNITGDLDIDGSLDVDNSGYIDFE